MGDFVSSVYGTFERFLRYVYPGFLFLLLLYLSQRDGYCLINAFGGNIWFLFVAGLIIGMAIQLIQAHVVTGLLNIIFKPLNWDVNVHTQVGCNPTIIVGHKKLQPECCCLKCIAKHYFDPNARVVERRCKNEQNHYSYLDALWARFHALSNTGLLFILFSCKEIISSNYITNLDTLNLHFISWHIIKIIGLLLLLAAIILYMTLTRVRHIAI